MSGQPSPYELAGMADCASPDSSESPGAVWLETVWSVADGYDEPRDWDVVGELADSCVPVYTHNRWQVFVDLAAYNEDPTDLGADGSDMNQAAGVCLYLIAERLIAAIWAEDGEDRG